MSLQSSSSEEAEKTEERAETTEERPYALLGPLALIVKTPTSFILSCSTKMHGRCKVAVEGSRMHGRSKAAKALFGPQGTV